MSSDRATSRDHLYTLANRGDYEQLVKYLRQHDSESVRFGAAGILAESTEGLRSNLTDEMQTALIRAVLSDSSEQVRNKVVYTLIQIDESTIDNIISRWASRPRSTPTDSPYPLILTRWESADAWPLRYLAVVGFGETASASAQTKLGRILFNERHATVLRRAINESGEIGNSDYVSPIQQYLRTDANEVELDGSTGVNEIKQAAVDALVKIGNDGAYEALVSASRSSDADLKKTVLSEIGRLGARETIDVVVDELDNDHNDAIREKAAEGVLTSFQQADRDSGDDIRQQAIQTIAKDIDADVSAEFRSVVEESQQKPEQRNAIWLLGKLECSDRQTAETLTECLSDNDEYVRKLAAASLTQFDPQVAIDEAQAILDTADEGSPAYELANFVTASLTDDAAEAKKNLVEYTKVSDPSDYTSE